MITTSTTFRTAFRHLLRNKSFSLINILGLSLGIAACLLIYGYVHHQQSFDTYHPKADRIARVISNFSSAESQLHFATSLTMLGRTIKKECPEVENVARIEPSSTTVQNNGSFFTEEHFVFSEPSVFSLFQFSFLDGTPASALSEPHSIILTKSTALRYFGDGPALGKTLVCDKQPYHVSAVIADRPSNSDIRIDAILWKDFETNTQWMQDDFESYTFVLFRGTPDFPTLRRQMDTMSAKYVQPELDRMDAKQDHISFDLEMLTDAHFSKGRLIDTPKGSRLFNNIFSLLAVFILLIAILNYINLSTARAERRAKEVAVKKVAGAKPLQLMAQFMGESFLLMVIAWLIGFALAEMAIPFFNRLLSSDITLTGWHSLLFFAWVLPLSAVLAGAWPAFVLSGFQPIRVLKGLAVQTQGIGLRKALTVVQFIIALAMLTGAVVIHRQMRYMMSRDLGADRSQMLALNIPGGDARHRENAFSQAVRKTSGVSGISLGTGIPVEGASVGTIAVYSSNGTKKEVMSNFFEIDPQFLPLLHIQLAEGRNFSEDQRTDKGESYLVNQAFVRAMGWRSGVGQIVPNKGKIIGVVKDFFYKSLHNPIEPAVLSYSSDSNANAVLVKAPPSVLPRLKNLWKEYFPNDPFSYYFLDESFDAQYEDDRMTMALFNGFTLLAIFISCLGLYGLISLITVRRTKEIGIRKVLGASGRGLTLLLTREFFVLMGLAALIALPLAGWGLHRWLGSYAYHTSLTVEMFFLPLAGLVFITLTVTGLRVVRAVTANPVESLRTE